MDRLRSFAFACLLAPAVAFAHEPQALAGAASGAIDAAAESAVAAVDAFSAALKAGDLRRVEALLDAGVQVLESGGAERSRAEYLQHHAGADAAFLKDASVRVLRRTARAEGALAWVASETELDAGGKTHLGTETMVLARSDAGWRIVHIHWSSREKKVNKR